MQKVREGFIFGVLNSATHNGVDFYEEYLTGYEKNDDESGRKIKFEGLGFYFYQVEIEAAHRRLEKTIAGLQ